MQASLIGWGLKSCQCLAVFILLLSSYSTLSNTPVKTKSTNLESTVEQRSAREYKGFINLKLIMPNQSQYAYAMSFNTNQQQLRSPIIASSESSKISNKYFFEFTVLNEAADQYDAKVSVYQNISLVNKAISQQKELFTYVFSGKLYQKNQFEFTAKNEPTLRIKLFMDKNFTLEEIKTRFNNEPSESK